MGSSRDGHYDHKFLRGMRNGNFFFKCGFIKTDGRTEVDMWFLFYLLCLMLTFSLGYCQSYGHIKDPVCCTTDSSNCTLYVNQTVSFICDCAKPPCVTTFISNNNSSTIKTVGGVNYTVNVTEDLKGVMACHTNKSPKPFNWTVTILLPKQPRFLKAPQGHYFSAEIINIGGADGTAPSCSICVNCSVSGVPMPKMTWQYQSRSMSGFDVVITNQSNSSSPYYQQENGQKLCFSDVRRYTVVAGNSYQCSAANVAGSISAIFNTIVNSDPLPQPGPSATKDPLYLGRKNVMLMMDTIYPDGLSAYFNVCRYNRSFPNTLISCCSCYGNCEFGELAGYTESNYVSCQLNTSYSGIYQFKIYTKNYPCFLNLGHPIEVNDVNNSSLNDNRFKLDFHILSYSLGGLCILLVFGILATFYVTRRFYKRQRRQFVHLDGDHHNADNPVDVPVSCRAPITASNSDEFPNSEFPNEQTPLLPRPDPDYTVRPVQSPAEHRTEHVHGMQAIMGNTDHQYTVDRSCEGPNENQGSIKPPPTDSSPSSEELFSIDRKNMDLVSSHCTKEQELVDPNDYPVLHIGSGHNMGGVKTFVSNQAGPLPMCFENGVSDTANNPSDKGPLKDTTTSKQALVPCNQKKKASKVVYITHCSDSKEWITSKLRPLLDELDVEILTIENAVVGQTIANARDELVNKADKIIVVFSWQFKEDKELPESKWLHYDLEQAKHKNPDLQKISFIPILYKDTKPEDLPRPLDNMIPIKADSSNLKEKLEESIFNS